MLKAALIVVTSHGQMGATDKPTGWYLSEVTHVYYPLIEAGFTVDFASPKGGAAPMDEKSRKLDDPQNKRFVEDAGLMARMRDTIPLSAVDADRYQVIHFAGGHGTMWDFADDRDLQRVTGRIYDQGGIVSAVCHGPAALVNVKLANGDYLVKGKEVAPFTDAEEAEAGLTKVVPFLLESRLKERGATVKPSTNWQDHIAVSDRLVTGQNPQSAHSVGKAIVTVAQQLGK